MGIITLKVTMKFAIFAVVVAVFSSQVLADAQYGSRNGNRYQPMGYGNNLMNMDWMRNIDPKISTESQNLLVKLLQRTNELIDGMPSNAEFARQMSELWGIAYPQLNGLLSKAGAWANQIPTSL